MLDLTSLWFSNGFTGMIKGFKGAIRCSKKLAIILKLGSRSSINFNNKIPSTPPKGWFEMVIYAPSLGNRFKSSSGISNLICRSSKMAFKKSTSFKCLFRSYNLLSADILSTFINTQPVKVPKIPYLSALIALATSLAVTNPI